MKKTYFLSLVTYFVMHRLSLHMNIDKLTQLQQCVCRECQKPATVMNLYVSVGL